MRTDNFGAEVSYRNGHFKVRHERADEVYFEVTGCGRKGGSRWVLGTLTARECRELFLEFAQEKQAEAAKP